MTFQTAAKAVELKNLIDHAHTYLPTIGRCLSLELEYRYDHMHQDDDDEDSKLEELQEKLVKIYDSKGYKMARSGFEDNSINVLGEEIASLNDITMDDVKKWYAAGTNSGFGNVIKQETQHDSHIRSSRELDASQFTVSQELLENIAMTWGEGFVPQSVMVQPYKIVIYGPGDHFQFHKDTPEENLCGTFLISLFQDCQPRDVFEIQQHGISTPWSGWKGRNGYCAFHPDIPHRVKPLDAGYRAILSFKIFATETENPREWSTSIANHLQTEKFVEELQNLDISVGILFRHHYGYDSKTIYGCDRLLLDAFERKELKVDLKPVLIHFSGTGPEPESGFYYESDPGSTSSQVYSITDGALDYVRRRLSGEKPEFPENLSEDTLFLDGQKCRGEGLWETEEQQASEWTGNESQPHSETSVYVRYAAIVHRKVAESI
jgi:hypothetical protein